MHPYWEGHSLHGRHMSSLLGQSAQAALDSAFAQGSITLAVPVKSRHKDLQASYIRT